MLTADLVRARRKGGVLHLVPLDAEARGRALWLSEKLIETTRALIGRTRDDFALAVAALDVGPREHVLRDGLAKLVEDRCGFDVRDDVDPPSVRRDVFARASAARAGLDAGASFDRAAVLDEAARGLGLSPDDVERALFADLRGAHGLVSFDAPSAAQLVETYERAQAQAVLLRAVKVTIEIRDASPGALRSFFRKLKFLRLLHVIERIDGGHRVVIDGPFSLFESVTKYGLQLALVLPALDECGEWRLEADVRWGKERAPLAFHIAGTAAKRSTKSPLPDDVRALVRSFAELGTPWRVAESTDVFDLPGVGLCIPDLVFERPDGSKRERVHLEVMGYWSRDAVWKRVELVRAGLARRILFAVSSRLRVSEDVLDDDLPGALYVYKQTMSARTIAARVDQLVSRAARF